MNLPFVLARNEAINQWLNEHPLVLGAGALLIGLVVAGFGIKELMTGVSKDKFGNVLKGGYGKSISIIRVLLGAGFAIFGLYRLIAG